MSKRYDICYGRESNGKTYWTKCGVMFEKEDGSRSIKLEVVPVGDFNGWLSVFEPKSKSDVPF